MSFHEAGGNLFVLIPTDASGTEWEAECKACGRRYAIGGSATVPKRLPDIAREHVPFCRKPELWER